MLHSQTARADARGPMRRVVLAVIACAFHCLSFAAPDHDRPGRLTGTYSIGAASLVDPVPDDKKDSLLRLHLTGNAARDVYGALAARPLRDQCFDDGTMTKSAGELLCAKHPNGTYECWIGIDLKMPKLAAGFVC